MMGLILPAPLNISQLCALLQKEASQRQQRRSVAPASQRRSDAAPTASQRRSVAASQRRSATRPRERHSATSETHVSAPFAPAL